MTRQYAPAERPTMYFIGVTTRKSSIMKVFPAWAEELGLAADLSGINFEPHSDPDDYREAVEFIKNDPMSLGALITTHKLDLYKAAHDLFDEVDDFAKLLEEVSSISKRPGRLVGHAKDPISSGLSLEAIVKDGYWRDSGGELLLLGSGGSSLALTLYLHNKARSGGDVPRRVVVTNRSPGRLEEMRSLHEKVGMAIPTEYRLAPTPKENDLEVNALVPGSMVVNATGLGKDRPGSPLTDAARFPEAGLVWEFNYRGDLLFLDQARAQQEEQDLKIVDGWVYFIHGWTQVIGEVFDLLIPPEGPTFDRLSSLAAAATERSTA
jgi:shikimate 5-dehydrogenase